jgi:tRNA (guanine-N7-)-methyltransferase
MRLRNIAGSREVIADSNFTVKDPEKIKGLWKKEIFGNVS